MEVVLSFITYNGYGNNLYLDNFNIGKQYNEDVAALSIAHIPADTSYIPGSGGYIISPKALVMNVGKYNAGPFDVSLTITPGTYASTVTVPALNIAGATYEVTFGVFIVVTGQPINLTLQTHLTGDQNNLLTIRITSIQCS